MVSYIRCKLASVKEPWSNYDVWRNNARPAAEIQRIIYIFLELVCLRLSSLSPTPLKASTCPVLVHLGVLDCFLLGAQFHLLIKMDFFYVPDLEMSYSMDEHDVILLHCKRILARNHMMHRSGSPPLLVVSASSAT